MTILVLVLRLMSSQPRYRTDLTDSPVSPATPQTAASVDRPPHVLQIVQLPSFILPFKGDVR